jgi:hypothetical protein
LEITEVGRTEMTESKMDRVQAHKAQRLASIVRRVEQCQATANRYGLAEAEAALSACLATLTGGGGKEGLRAISEETFEESRSRAEADARKAAAK